MNKDDEKPNWTEIPNEILEALMAFRIPGQERQIFDCIVRKTWGWHKNTDDIALSQFEDATGLARSNIIRALKGLESKNLIIVIKNDNKSCKSYRISNSKRFRFYKNI